MVVFALALAIVIVAPAGAASPPALAASPKEVLETFFERANAILRSADPERGIEAPRQAIRALVNELFDYQDAAARALGPAWQTRTPGQQAEFVQLFADFVERGYVAFVGSKVHVADGLKVGYVEELVTPDGAAVATTLLSRNGSDLDVDYIMVRRGESWMVRDVIVDGMSLVSNYRAQFNRILATSSYADLVARMQGEVLEQAQPVLSAAPPAATMEQPTSELGQSQPAPVQPATPVSTPEVVLTAATAPPAAAPPAAAALPRDEVVPKVGEIRVSGPEPMTVERVALRGAGRPGTIRYWIQVGAFKTVDAAAQLAERLRRQGVAASNDTLTSAPWHPAGALARVRVGPFATQSDARSKLRELMARGYSPFIAETRD
jgi:phospholipid transport system substrate-binding protein